MDLIWNKVILLILCVFTQFHQAPTIHGILPFLSCLICSLLHDLLPSHRFKLYILYLLLMIVYPLFLFFLPLMVYDTYSRKHWYRLLPYLIIYLYYRAIDWDMWQIMTLFFCAIACILKDQKVRHDVLLNTYRLQRDSSKEVTLLLEEKNRDLMIQQNYEIQVATLDERNRIAREIHDNVGHLLSSSLLQIGAIQVINEKEAMKQSLSTLRTTLSTAMDEIRSSVHNLHEDAIQLDMEIEKLIKEFTFCNVSFIYDIEDILSKDLKYHILAIVKEALHNIVSHSNADKAMISLREQPSFYQLIIEDNGTKTSTKKDGIGLQNIQYRISLYHGYMNIQKDKGFRIFITIPKEAKK